jgi:prepilin-type N-terminal cleavage/methylation domain-containing protein
MKRESGFSLVEMLVVMVILSIVLVIVGQFITSQTTILRKQQLIANTQQNLRVAGELITSDLMMACLNPMGAPSDTFAFKVFQPQRCEFTMDLDGNGAYTPRIDSLPKRDEWRGFVLVGDTLKRIRVPNSLLNAEDIAVGVYALTFTYLDKNGNVVTPGPDNGRIARVRFQIAVRSTRPYRDTTHIIRRTASLVMVRNRAF